MAVAVHERTLTTSEAKAFYDRFGAKQDSQAYYEDVAVAELIANSDFENATHVFEFGCGTGRLAERLLEHHLPADATYRGVDTSTTMVGIAASRLARFGARAVVSEGSDFPEAGAVDRVVTTYVLDLLAREAIEHTIAESARALTARGKLCIASLTNGRSVPTRLVSAVWRFVFRLSPRLVGGCRPVHLVPYLDTRTWRVLHERVVSAYGIASEVVVVEKRLTRAAASQHATEIAGR